MRSPIAPDREERQRGRAHIEAQRPLILRGVRAERQREAAVRSVICDRSAAPRAAATRRPRPGPRPHASRARASRDAARDGRRAARLSAWAHTERTMRWRRTPPLPRSRRPGARRPGGPLSPLREVAAPMARIGTAYCSPPTRGRSPRAEREPRDSRDCPWH